jgi:TolB protein
VAIAPDGKKMAYATAFNVGNLWRVPILEGRLATWQDAQQVTFEQGEVNMASVFPDRLHLVISLERGGNTDLWRLPTRGGELERLTTNPAPDYSPSLSPDGREIVFHSTRSGNRDIWTIPAAGGSARQLTVDPGNDWWPDWSRDGRQIAWGFEGGLRVCAVEDCVPRDLTTDVGGFPDWSPDGAWIVFNYAGGNPVRLVSAAGGSLRELTREPEGLARWSTDGEEVYFLGRGVDDRKADSIWAVTIEDRQERPLTNLEGRPGRMSPYVLATDGDYLFFTWQEFRGDVWVVDIVD